MLLPVAAAEKIVWANVPRLPTEDCPLTAAQGRVLREPVVADRDLPPFDRAMLDGIAVIHAACAAGRRTFAIAGMQAAGTIRQNLRDHTTCIQIATGAPLPRGCDTVIPVEEIQIVGNNATLRRGWRTAGRRGNGVHRRGSDATTGAVVIPAGTRLAAHDIGIAAAVGRATLRVALGPRVAVVATGDELVDVGTRPAPHQIRRSNDYALQALLLAAGCAVADRFHLRDVEHEIETTLRKLITEYDWLVLCGGVSKGRFDFLPKVLAGLRVRRCFQGVAQRPGRPFWFGVTPRHTPVFALPGNPVAALVCARRYFLPALSHAALEEGRSGRRVALDAPLEASPDLTLFVPARLNERRDGRLVVHPMAVNNSGDFAGLCGTDGFVEIPPATGRIRRGALVDWYPWR